VEEQSRKMGAEDLGLGDMKEGEVKEKSCFLIVGG